MIKMSINLNRLEIFVTVVDTGSFSKASLARGVPKSSISRQIRLLEEELGVNLIYRTTRKLELTHDGKKLYKEAKIGLGHLTQIFNELKKSEEEIEGKLRFTCPYDMGVVVMTKILSELKTEFPKMHFDVILTNDQLDLVKESIDMALRIGILKDSQYRQKRIGVVKSVLVVSPKLQKMRGEKIKSLNDLNLYPKLGFGPSKTLSAWTFKSRTEKIKFKFDPDLNANDFLFLKELILAGFGVGELPYFLAKPLIEKGEIEEVLSQYELASAPIQLVFPPQKKLNAKVKIVSDRLQELLVNYFE